MGNQQQVQANNHYQTQHVSQPVRHTVTGQNKHRAISVAEAPQSMVDAQGHMTL